MTSADIVAMQNKGWINGPIGFRRKWALSGRGSVALSEAGGCVQEPFGHGWNRRAKAKAGTS